MGGKKFWRIGLLGLALLLLIAAIIYADTPREPCYQGRTLTQWIDSAPSRMYNHFGPLPSAPPDPWEVATNAMQQMGPDALWWLVKWSGTHDSKLQTTVVKWLISHTPFRPNFTAPSTKRRRALAGFELLGANGARATAALIKKTRDWDPKARVCALECLEKIEAPHETLFPVCFRLMDDPDSYVRAKASWCENDLEMAMTLRTDVKDRQAFLSPLLRWINDPDPSVQQHSAKLLHFYFPQEAEKAGVYRKFPELRNARTAVNTF